MSLLPRVLVAEDDDLLRRVLRDELTDAGFDVTVAVDGADAVERARTAGPFDVLVFDERLPRLSGSRAVAALRLAGVAAPAVIMSGELLPGTEPGSQGFLRKPFLIHDLIAALWTALRCESLVEPGLSVAGSTPGASGKREEHWRERPGTR